MEHEAIGLLMVAGGVLLIVAVMVWDRWPRS